MELSVLNLIAIIANGIFLVSYGFFASHIWHRKSVEGVSPWALGMWLVAFFLLFVGFTAQFRINPNMWNLIFACYYAAGLILSIVAIEGWRRFR